MENLETVKTLLSTANTVLILLPPKPDTDSLSAALSLHQSLKNAGKTSTIGASSLPDNPPKLDGLSEIKKTIGNQKLVISFDYQEDQVENVSYDIDEATKKFNLVIQPKAGQTPLDPKNLEFSYSGAQADLVITFGINSLEELGRLYSQEKTFLDQVKILSLNSTPRPASFTQFQLTHPSLNQLVIKLLVATGLTPTEATATNLYRQLLQSTNNFQSSEVDADTFEQAAFLLRSGAKRSITSPQPLQPIQPIAVSTPPSYRPAPAPASAPLTTPPSVPADWQKPKIYSSAGTLK